MDGERKGESARPPAPVRGRERGEAVGSEEAVMGESIGVEWIHLSLLRGHQVWPVEERSGGEAGVAGSRGNDEKHKPTVNGPGTGCDYPADFLVTRFLLSAQYRTGLINT